MSAERLYPDLASWYPLLTAPADYVEDAVIIASVIDAHSLRPVRDVLELGCRFPHEPAALSAAARQQR